MQVYRGRNFLRGARITDRWLTALAGGTAVATSSCSYRARSPSTVSAFRWAEGSASLLVRGLSHPGAVRLVEGAAEDGWRAGDFSDRGCNASSAWSASWTCGSPR